MDLESQIEIITGPQIPIGDSWFDRTQIEKARLHGEACPATPPTDESGLNSFILLNYYDLPLSLRIAYERTKDPQFLTLFRKCADAWWKTPGWIEEGNKRLFVEGIATPPPRHAGIGGLMLRALDGRPEMWEWIVGYAQAHLDIWCKSRINNNQLWYGPREVAFSLQFAAWIARVLPDSYPNASQIRTQLIADLENLVVNYTGRLQFPDGSWRDSSEWFDNVLAVLSQDAPAQTTQVRVQPLAFPVSTGQKVEFANGGVTNTTKAQLAGSVVIDVEPLPVSRAANSILYVADGTAMVGTMQPFIVGLLVCALVDVHQVLSDGPTRESVKTQILKACRHVYSDGPYAKDLIEQKSGRRVRGFHYFYHGGTTLNPTKYEKGSMVAPWTDLEGWWLASARQAISTILPAFGYAYKISGDPFFKDAGDEMFDSAYNGTDGARAMMDDTAKNYNQHARRAASYLAWTGSVPQPIPTPEPQPQPEPVPPPTIPAPLPGSTVTDFTGGVWTIGPNKETLRNEIWMSGGRGTEYRYVDQIVYVLGMDNNWWKWINNGWVQHGATAPGTTPTPTPAPEPKPEPPPVPAPPRVLLWPNDKSAQSALWKAQAVEGYRANQHVPRPSGAPKGNYVEFVKW
jgi:hypothetical protein